MNVWKYRSKGLVKAIFCDQKSKKKAGRPYMKFCQPPKQVCRGAYISYFKINVTIFCCLLFSEYYLNPQVRINKMINKHTVDYHPSPSQWSFRIHSLIFVWTPKVLIYAESFLNFFLNLYIPCGCGKVSNL